MKNREKQELMKMEVAELKARADEVRKELFLFRMKKFSSPEKNTSLAKNLRKDLARLLTFAHEKESHGN